MAPPNLLATQEIGSYSEPGVLLTTLQTIASRAHQAARECGFDRREVSSLARQIRRVRGEVEGRFGEEINRWLENLQARVDGLHAREPGYCCDAPVRGSRRVEKTVA